MEKTMVRAVLLIVFLFVGGEAQNTVCSRPLDLIFAVDVSGSIDNTEFTQTRTFISNVVAALVEFIGVSDSGVRIVVLGFDQEARFSNASRLDQPAALSIDGVRDQLTNLPYTHGATLIEEGLQAAADVFNTSSVRQNATRVVVVITDGVNYNGNSGLVQAAELLRTNFSARVISLGVGPANVIDEDTLNVLAGPGNSNQVLILNFNQNSCNDGDDDDDDDDSSDDSDDDSGSDSDGGEGDNCSSDVSRTVSLICG